MFGGGGRGETVKMIAYCNHMLHADCIEKWLENQVISPVCQYSDRSEKVELVTVRGGDEEVALFFVTS